MSERRPPHNMDAERAVLGTLLVASERLNEVADVLSPSDFYLPEHGTIFNRMLRIRERPSAFDFVILKDALATAGELDQVGGPAYIASLDDGVPRSTNLEYYAGIVREKAMLRQLIHACDKAREEAYGGELSFEDLIEQTEADILSVGQGSVRSDFVLADEWVHDTVQHLEKLAEERRDVTGVSSGFRDLDRLTRGLQPGDLIIVGARPSMGKTAFALQLALHAASIGMVGVFSAEMAKRSLGFRAFSVTGRVNSMRLLTGRLLPSDFARVSAAMESLASLKLAIDDSAVITLAQLRVKARRLKAQHGLSMLVVDYLQILEPGGPRRSENRTLELAQMSRGLKQLAKELQVPVIVLSQLSRQLESREEKRPRLSDLRESGAIEQDADVVLLLHRPEYYQSVPSDETLGKAEVIVAKHRNGPLGVVELRFTKETMRFDELELRRAS